MLRHGTLAIIYKLSIECGKEKYILIGQTMNLEQTQSEIIADLKNGTHENKKLQKLFNLVIGITDPKEFNYYFKFETLQALRKAYYPVNILPLVMEQLERSFIQTIRADYKSRGKEYLVLNQ